jgi:hypothetical protein
MTGEFVDRCTVVAGQTAAPRIVVGGAALTVSTQKKHHLIMFLPGRKKKEPSPEDMNFQCMDDGSVNSEEGIGVLGGMLEEQKPPPSKKTSSSSVSLFQRMKSLTNTRKKNKSDDTVITGIGDIYENGKEEEEEDSSSSSDSEESTYDPGKKLPSNVMDLGDDSDSDEGDTFQCMPSGLTRGLKTGENASPVASRPRLLTAPSGRGLASSSPLQKERPKMLPAPSGRGLSSTSPLQAEKLKVASTIPEAMSAVSEEPPRPPRPPQLVLPQLRPRPRRRGDGSLRGSGRSIVGLPNLTRSKSSEISVLAVPVAPASPAAGRSRTSRTVTRTAAMETSTPALLEEPPQTESVAKPSARLAAPEGPGIATASPKPPHRRLGGRNASSSTDEANRSDARISGDRPPSLPPQSPTRERSRRRLKPSNSIDMEKADPTMPPPQSSTRERSRRRLKPTKSHDSALAIPEPVSPTRERRRGVQHTRSVDSLNFGPGAPLQKSPSSRNISQRLVQLRPGATDISSPRLSPSKQKSELRLLIESRDNRKGTPEDVPKAPSSPRRAVSTSTNK